MAKSEKQKNEALRLHKGGMAPSKIAAKMNVSTRTVQRWLRDETPVPVQVVAMKADSDVPQSMAKNVTNCRDKFDFNLSRRMAIRLLNLSEVALDAVEATLTDPDARRSDKLRAAKLVGDWLGLGSAARHASGNFVSVPSRVEQVFATQLAPPVQTPPLAPSPSTRFDEEE